MKVFSTILFCLTSTILIAQSYQSGRRTVNFYDASRFRFISTEIYYPADVAGTDVAVAAGSTSFPVVVFGHGYLMPVTAYSWLADSLVKAGYIVAMPSTESSITPSHSVFAADLAFLCNRITSANDSAAFFLYQRIVNRSAVGGHSMGGGSSFLAMAGNNSINALFNFCAAEAVPSSTQAAYSVNKPSLVISGSNDCIVAASVQQGMYNNIPYPCKAYINITGALHCQFSSNNSACTFGQATNGCNSSPITVDTVVRKVLKVLVPFLDSYLKGSCLSPQFIDAYSSLTGVTATRICNSDPVCATVPVSLISFVGRKENTGTILSWTASESGAVNYVIERSDDGWRFTPVGKVSAKNQVTANYRLIDSYSSKADLYFRLRINSADGSYKYSNVILIKADNSYTISSCYPNPARNQLMVSVRSREINSLTMVVTDLQGRRMIKRNFETNSTDKQIVLDIKSLVKGTYLVTIRNEKNELLKNDLFVKD